MDNDDKDDEADDIIE